MKYKTPKNKRKKIKPNNKRFDFYILNSVATNYDLNEQIYIKAGIIYNKPAMQVIIEIIMQLLA